MNAATDEDYSSFKEYKDDMESFTFADVFNQ